MSGPVKPALTPEEWGNARLEVPLGEGVVAGHYHDRQLGMWHALTLTRPAAPRPATFAPYGDACHALAALALRGTPDGFRHADLTFLRDRVLGGWAKYVPALDKEDVEYFQWLYDRIAALLPPEPTP